MKILLTGFDPFGEDIINPSYEAIKRIKDFNDIDIIKCELPTVRYESVERIKDIIEKEKDIDYIISFGQAGGRKAISLERVAINCDDYRIQDNRGNQPKDEKIIEDGPDAYFSNLPLRKIEKALNDKNIKVEISNSAGTFVCNHIFYSIRYLCETKYPYIKSGFIHVPYIETQIKDEATPYMKLDDIILAIETIIEVIKESG